MIDLDELIAEAREFADRNNGLNWQGMVRDLADALVSVRAERDAALEVMSNHRCGENVEAAYRRAVDAEARIAELEKSRDRWEELCGKIASEKYDLNARIAEAAKLHRETTCEEDCCGAQPCCYECGPGAGWPCPTAVALGLNEGENDV